MPDLTPAPVAPASTPAPAAAPASPATPATIIDPPTPSGDPAPEPTPAPGAWGDDWRERMAGGNEKVLAQIKRFTSPETMASAFFNARQELSSRPKPPPAKDATPEQIAAWRKDSGIPEAPEGYLENVPNGLVIGETDKPLMAEFAKDMHALNAPPAFVHSAIQSYYRIQEAQAAKAEEANEQAREEGTQTLMAEWGQDFKGNKNAIAGMLSMMPEDARSAILNARDAEGVAIFNRASVVKAFAQLARELNPAASVVPNHGGNPAKSIADELKSLNIGSDEYWKDPAKQARARELLLAQERLGSKAA